MCSSRELYLDATPCIGQMYPKSIIDENGNDLQFEM